MLKKIVDFLVEAVSLVISICVGFGAYYLLAPLAEAERGYFGAVGGEFFAAVAVGVVVYHVIGRAVDCFMERWDDDE